MKTLNEIISKSKCLLKKTAKVALITSILGCCDINSTNSDAYSSEDFREPSTLSLILKPKLIEKINSETTPSSFTRTNEPKSDVSLIVIDNNGNNYKFENSRTSGFFMNSPFKYNFVTIQSENKYHVIDILRAKDIDYGANIITLNNGEKLTGSKVRSNEINNFYRDRNNPIESDWLYGTVGDNSVKINFNNIKKIRNVSSNDSEEKKPYFKSMPLHNIILKNGEEFKTDSSHVLDFYGSHWRGRYSTKLNGVVVDQENKKINYSDINKILFQGKQSGTQNRLLTIKMDNDLNRDATLIMHSESYGGRLNSSTRFGNFDKMFISKPYGGVIVKLDDVSKLRIQRGDGD
jgi:hypothetical protein